MESLTIREKRTSPITFQLLADGDPIDLTSVHHVSMHMMDSKSKVYRYNSSDTTPAVTIVTPATGSVSFTPPDDTVFNYLRTPYQVYWLVWVTAAQKYSVPEGDAAIINMVKEY